MNFTPAELAYLRTQNLGRLATVDRAAAPQNNPVGFHVNEDGTVDIYGRAMAATRKWRNIATNPQVALVIDDLASTNPWTVRGIEIRGTATQTIVDQPAGSYGQPETIHIQPDTIISWGIEPDNQAMTTRRR